MLKKLEQISIDKLGKDLQSSEKAVGQLYPVLRDAEGKVIDGWHRLDANPNWKSVVLKDVKTEEDRLIVSAHVNLGRRDISVNEKRNIVNDLAEIYYKQGLRPDTRKDIMDKNNILRKNVHYNEIKYKLVEVLNGIMNKSQIKNYLDSKYLNQEYSKRKKKYYREKHNATSPYSLLKSSHGKQLRNTYGDNFFERLDAEMFDKGFKEAKDYLSNSDNIDARDFRGTIRKEIEFKVRSHYREEIRIILNASEDKLRLELREEIKLELIEEFNLDVQGLVVAV